jgi:hypothetical protein
MSGKGFVKGREGGLIPSLALVTFHPLLHQVINQCHNSRKQLQDKDNKR